ncbi:MAG: DUF805 domain-containing protein [Thermoguttaceae bacterium]|nr:DUF805 domain-containing protein [Thermoguttaceae bacterium]MBQ6829275.1 DUF805 domain-containing protein [Thermoguttaceae bacterium]
MANFCRRCGSQLETNVSFCAQCGAPCQTGVANANWGDPNPYEANAEVVRNATAPYANAPVDATVGPCFNEAYSYAWSHYGDFSGRATRTEFWAWSLWNVALTVLLFFAGLVLAAVSEGGPALALLVMAGWGLATIIPTYAVGCRRLHDLNISGMHLLIVVILGALGGVMMFQAATSGSQEMVMAAYGITALGNLYGFVLWIMMGFVPGTRGPNRFGLFRYTGGKTR